MSSTNIKKIFAQFKEYGFRPYIQRFVLFFSRNFSIVVPLSHWTKNIHIKSRKVMCVLGTAHGVVRVFGKIVAARPPTVWLEFLIKLSQAGTFFFDFFFEFLFCKKKLFFSLYFTLKNTKDWGVGNCLL